MALFLYRLGRLSFVHRRFVLGLWVAILIVSSVAAATLSGPTSTSFSIPGTPAQEAIDTLQARFPSADAGGATARVVFAAPEGGVAHRPCIHGGRGRGARGRGRRGQGRLRVRPVHDRHGQP